MGRSLLKQCKVPSVLLMRNISKLFKHGFITEDALVWAEGEEAWLPLKASHQLFSALAFQGDENKAIISGRNSKPQDAQIASFHAELAAIEAGIEPEVGDEEDPEETEFVDDDGTRFVWDPEMKRFRPEIEPLAASAPIPPLAGTSEQESAKAAVAEYDVEEMRFVPTEEPLVTIEDAMAEEERSREAAEGLLNSDAPSRPIATGVSAVPGSGQLSTKPHAHNNAKRPNDGPDPDSEIHARKCKRTDMGQVLSAVSDEHAAHTISAAEAAKPVHRKNNTAIYVTGIPESATVEEIASEFRRCGIIREDDDGQPRVKLYRDKATGMLKGDCLITFLQQPSVNLAIKVMHGRSLRPGQGPTMSVQEASFQSKPEDVHHKRSVTKPGGKGTQKKNPLAQKQHNRLLSWSGFDDVYKVSEVTVLAAGLFTVEEMTMSPDLEEELQNYLLLRCRDLGAIDKVKVYRHSPAGVATVKLRRPDAAQQALKRLQSTVKLRHMLPGPAATTDAAHMTEIKEDLALKLADVGLGASLARKVEGGAVQVLCGSAHGGVLVAFTEDTAARRCAAALKGMTYDGRAIDTCVMHAEMWDGKLAPSKFGQDDSENEAERLEAFAQDLEAG